MIENVSTQLTVFHCFAHCLLPGRAFASLYVLLFLEKEAEIGGRVYRESYICNVVGVSLQWRSQNDEKVTHIKGRLLCQALILYNYVPFQIRTSLKGKNLLPEGANSFLYEQFLIVWKITFITLHVSDLP